MSDASVRKIEKYDVAIIGAGVCGCAAAFELSKYELKICLLERENDICCATSKANSGIIHAGFDAPEGSLMAKYNVAGAKLTPKLARELDVEYKQNGALVVAFDSQQEETLKELLERGKRNGVEELSIISKDELARLEPNISDKAVCALWARTSGIIMPWDLGLALCETAVLNGCFLKRGFEASSIARKNGAWEISSFGETVEAGYIINAAGLFSDEIARMAGASEFNIKPVKGQYYLLDRSQGSLFTRTVFQCPTKAGKGVLASPTAEGNLIIGPDASPSADKTDLSTTAESLAFIKKHAFLDTDKINFRENIRNFSGLRAYTDDPKGDFIIGPDAKAERFINIAGMKSPGLTSACAVAKDLYGMLEGLGLKAEIKKEYIKTRKKLRFSKLSHEQREKLVKDDPAYGKIICRCNTVTEGEITALFKSPVPPLSIDGVKRRTGSGLGRCQGGFCQPAVLRILAEGLGISPQEVCLERKGSYIVTEAR